MASNANNAGANTGNALKEGIAKIHGMGEALRGNINTFADSATSTDSTRSERVASRGQEEMDTGKYQGTGAGVTPRDTGAERAERAVQGEGSGIARGSEARGTGL
ncbi:hypothetical protein LTS18_007479 [Coniosporium uncinatum]|uniref:Uncharacterized protein n=1 Tax=Coniosporium uncinatum TaxID=93489 RepID=A0ACC3D2S7_9PEZI|nr:hypothetical protein LTS18_007479 [Coniosporium uncinatum]